MFLWDLVDGLWATKSKDVGLIDRAISFQDFQPMWSWSTNVTDRRTDRQTDRQTDRRTTCNLNTALCTSASCGKKQIRTKLDFFAIQYAKCLMLWNKYCSNCCACVNRCTCTTLLLNWLSVQNVCLLPFTHAVRYLQKLLQICGLFLLSCRFSQIICKLTFAQQFSEASLYYTTIH